MMIHETVPHKFQRGTIIPLVKDHHGNKSDMNNYRGITIAPIIFEYSLQMIFQQFLTTSKYQFGFKKSHQLVTLYSAYKKLLTTTLVMAAICAALSSTH